MNLLWQLRREENYFWEALGASLILHFLIFHMGDFVSRLPARHQVEIDITNMGHRVPAAVSRPAPAPTPTPPAAKPAAPPKEWLKSDQPVAPAAPPTKAVAPEPEPAAPAPPPELGIGTGDGAENTLSRLPQLKNLSELGAILKRFYPERARDEGREATVILDIHIGTDGKITAVDVVQSADPDFNDAAVQVAKLLRFSPAFMTDHPVAVKMRQAIQFRLQR